MPPPWYGDVDKVTQTHEALTNLHFFVAMLKTDTLAGKVHFLKNVVCDLDL